ncbi:MAG: cache domain-containing protein [Candidatus Tenebribacter davisii]|nr:cache domain-containing protein [Candidatus Tenebribacter davisii]
MKKMIFLFLAIGLSLILLAETPILNEPIKEKLQEQNRYSGSALASIDDRVKYGSPLEAKIMVEEGIERMKEVDIKEAFLDFRNKGGKFQNKDLYLFVFDMDGNVLSHGAEKELIGKNLIDLKDSAGKYFVKDFLKLMRNSENGWVEYYWRNYENQKVEMKLTYLKKFNENIFIGCGAYQPRY